MAETVKTIKLHIHVSDGDKGKLVRLTERYAAACSWISGYIFGHGFGLDFMHVQKAVYADIRSRFGLKSQSAISAIKTATARYKAIQEQLYQHPYRYQDEEGKWQYISRTLEWLQKPVVFRRPQADLVRNRDYSFVRVDGGTVLSLNTLDGRIHAPFDMPECFAGYFDGSWHFGGGKLVPLSGEWYFHLSVSKEAAGEFSPDAPRHVVGVDRGLRFLAVSYDEKGKTMFFNGRDIMHRRCSFQDVRSGLQSRGTKSAKRALKRISGRENRWMSDVDHRISKTLVSKYGEGTLFVLEDLKGVSFSGENLASRDAGGRHQLRSWPFCQFEQYLTYKAHAAGSEVLKVRPDYTSQRCLKCGRIRKENRKRDTHEYACDCCGCRSNDDRAAAMNLQLLGTMYLSGDMNPRFGVRRSA